MYANNEELKYNREDIVWFVCSTFILLMILSCREQDNLLGDVSGDTSLIILFSACINHRVDKID